MLPELLNGKEKCTLIETMAGEGVVIGPGFHFVFTNLEEAKSFIIKKGWEINIHFIKGSPIMREKLLHEMEQGVEGKKDGICEMQEKTGA